MSTLATTRLVQSPIFVLSSIRSGSTLLRCILDTHSGIHAPHELHLDDLRVRPASITTTALELLGFTREGLEYDLWDSILHTLLANSGKQHIVDKTPGNLLSWHQIAEHWPQARYLMLTRHPGDILASAVASRPPEHAVEPLPLVLTYLTNLRDAINTLPGLVVRYEDLTTQPASETSRICHYLGVAWEQEMCDYGSRDHGPYEFGIGDFGDKIRSGRIHSAQPTMRPIPAAMHAIAADLGYSDQQAAV